MKRLLFQLMLLCATLPLAAQTFWDGTADKNLPGEGSEASPYLISTPEQLAGLAARVNDDKEDFAGKYIRLTQDIYLTELAEGKDTLDWEPIGHSVWKWGEETEYAYFRGIFDGDGHAIHNLYYGKGADFGDGFDPSDFDTELSDLDFSVWDKGLFCNVDGGTIKNLTLSNAMMSGASHAAMIAVFLSEGSTVSNCHVQGKMHGLQVSMGGIVSKNEGLVENCTAEIETDVAGMGGIVYENQTAGIVRDCSASGSIRCTAGGAGGIVVTNSGLIERCSASVDIQALYGTNGAQYNPRSAGGLVHTNNESGIIRECSATGNLCANGNGQIGGFAVYNYGLIESSYATGRLSDITDKNTLAGSVGMAQFVRYNGELAHHYGDNAYPGNCINCFTTSVCELRRDDDQSEDFYINNCAAFLYEYNHGQAGFSDPYHAYSREIGCYWNKDGIPQAGSINNPYIGKDCTIAYMQSQAFVDELNKTARFIGTSQWEYRAGQLPRATGVYTKDASDFFDGGDGSEENPYLIGNKEQLENVGWLVDNGFDFSKTYLKQTADIELNMPMANWGQEMPTEWQPIGGTHEHSQLVSVDYVFKGNYDGGFHQVKNMYIDNVKDFQGFFGIVGDSTTIRNLGVTDAYAHATKVGILVGKVGAGYGLIQCWTSGDVESQGVPKNGYAQAGAIAAELGRPGRVLNCMSTARVSSGHAGAVSPDTRSWAGDSIVNCIYAGIISSSAYPPSAWFQYQENAFHDNDVTGITYNGQYGRTTAWLQSKECVNTLNDAVSRWNVSHGEDLQLNYWQWQEGQYPHVSPTADYQPSVTITFVSNGGTDVINTVLEEGSQATAPGRPVREGYYFAGWYKDEALTQFFDWQNTTLTESLTLYAKWIEDHSNDVDVTPFNNKFTKEYHIKTVAQLRGLAQVVAGKWDWSNYDGTNLDLTSYQPIQLVAPRDLEGCTIYLDSDLVLNDTTDWRYWGYDCYAEPWKPIGMTDWMPTAGRSKFNCTFDGQGHTISGMYIEMSAVKAYDSQRYYWGLFGGLGEGAVIKDLGIEASVINGKEYDDIDHYIDQQMNAAGLLAGYAFGSTIEKCYARGRIIEDGRRDKLCRDIGGLIGKSDNWRDITMSDCYALVDMEADLSGELYLTGYGLIGQNEPRGTITNCYSGGQSYRGLSSWSSSMTVKNSYYDKEKITNENRCTGTGKTTAEMKQQSTYEGWDFETVWGISASINDGYPFLRQFHPDFKENAVLTTTPTAVAGLVYTGEPLTLVTAGVAEGGEVLYALSADGEFSAELPTATYPGDYTVYYKVVGDDSHNSLPIAGPIIATINKAAGVISFAESSMSKTYGDADFTNTLTNTGDGTVTYTSNNENIAIVNSETGEVTIKGAGTATITATVTDGTNYAYATTTATFTIGVNTAAITVSAEGFTGTYDGANHTITVTVSEPEGTTVKYGTTAGEYALDAAPTYTDAGEYTIYYQVTKANYTTVENSAVVSILKAAASISYETTAVSKTFGDEAFINALTMTGDGTVTYSSDNMNVAIVNSETGEVTITGAGTATIKATVVDGTNYTYATKTAQYTMTVKTATGISDVKTDTAEKAKWYDLSGRPLNGEPTQAGVYVKNGKKVVIK